MVYDPDPFSRPVAPPRHSVESDSEDDELVLNPNHAGSSAHAQRHSTGGSSSQAPVFRPAQSGSASTREQGKGKALLVVLAPTLSSGPGASSGAALAAALGPFAQLPSDGSFELSSRGDGSSSHSSSSSSIDGGAVQAALRTRHAELDILLLAPDVEGLQHPTASLLAREVVDSIKPTSITVLSTYWPPTYIVSPDLDPPDSAEPPVRYLCSPVSQAEPLQHAAKAHLQNSSDAAPLLAFDVPNALTGIDGALVLQATLRQIPITVLLQPFEMLHSLGSQKVDPIFPLDPGTASSPLPAVLAASLALPSPTSLAQVLQQTIGIREPGISSGVAATTGDFLRARRRRKVEDEAAVHERLVGSGREGQSGQRQVVESSLYV